jgi:hypothetical protein
LRQALLLFFLVLFRGISADLTVARVTAMAKTYFRDSAEVPMTVSVGTVVTDSTGRMKHQGQSTVRLIFHGYNQSSGHFSLRGDSGWFNTGALRDSIVGDVTAFMAAAMISPFKEQTRTVQIIPPSTVLVSDGECPVLELAPRWMVPKQFCGTGRFRLAETGGELTFEHFSFDSMGRPARARIAYLGDVQCTAFHADLEFQKVLLPGDSRPYFWPKETVTVLTTNKGKVTITNRYAAKGR